MYCNAGTDSLPSGGIFSITDTVGRVEADVEQITEKDLSAHSLSLCFFSFLIEEVVPSLSDTY